MLTPTSRVCSGAPELACQSLTVLSLEADAIRFIGKVIKPKLNIPVTFHTLPVADGPGRAVESMICAIAVNRRVQHL
jgi:hypothetical protein